MSDPARRTKQLSIRSRWNTFKRLWTCFRVKRVTSHCPKKVRYPTLLTAFSDDTIGELEYYNMDYPRRGLAVIINNYSFVSHSARKGSEHDVKAMRRVLTLLGFEVKEHENVGAKELQEQMKWYAKQNHSDAACFFAVIMSHGKRGCLYGNAGSEISYEELTSPFRSKECRSLAGKPKVFVVQVTKEGIL